MEQSNKYWTKPQKGDMMSGLKVRNTLNGDKQLIEFIPIKDGSVRWYMCGPTVYDHSHMGHARTYVCSDAIKRIMRDYFGYNVILQMNITDIDDKIIKRANESQQDYEQFSRHFENEFFKDMNNLGVEEPEILTRVSEFVPEIVEYIQKIIDNGFAYESNGSVYFDTTRFMKDQRFKYGQLEPTAINDAKLLQEGEGVLNNDNMDKEKRSERDFALWKKSKENEPEWDSQWGKGRPGWHIECSAMAGYHFDCPIDIHSGGEDLKFPHHTNEIAQSEAYYEQNQWVNYFLHTGHLHIDGLKMSKSLKNFISIQALLKTYNSRQLRLLFLLHKYDTLMNYNADSLTESINKEKNYKEFFLNMKQLMKQNHLQQNQKWSDYDKSLFNRFQQIREQIHEHLCNNFNTPDVLTELDKLIKLSYKYQQEQTVKFTVLRNIVDYVDYIFKCMGLQFQTDSQQDTELLNKIVDSFIQFRDQIKTHSKNQDFKSLLDSCDQVRDDILPFLGIRIEDSTSGQPSIWKMENPEDLIKQRELKKAEQKKKEELKKQKEKLKAEKEAEKQAKMKINPKEMFISQTDKYSEFNENGVPIKDKDGKELSKNQVKKVQKEWEKQNELYKKYLEQNQ